jgi:ATP-dependent Clp protease protease subunit
MPHPWYRIVNVGPGADGAATARLDIFDDIGETTDWWTGDKSGIAAADFIASINALGKLDTLDLHVNSRGGDLHAGLAIHNELKRNPAHVNVYVDGQAASIASIIAMAGDTVIMPANASLWVHNPMTSFRASLQGYSPDLREVAREALHLADDLDTYALTLANIYAGRSGGKLDAAAALALMDGETLITAERAVELGLADQIEQPLTAVNARDPREALDASAAGLKAAIEAAVARPNPPPAPPAQPPAPTGPVAMAPKDLVAACQTAGFADLAPALIAADAPQARVEEHLRVAREIKDRCAAAGVVAEAPALITAALGEGVGAVVGRVLALRREQLDPSIANHLPPDGRPGAVAPGVIDYRAIYAARRRRA